MAEHRRPQGDPPRDPTAWLVTVAWRIFLDPTPTEAALRSVTDT